MFPASNPAPADDGTDTINEAPKQYGNGEFADAAKSLGYAARFIRQKKGGQLETFLPQPLPGWQAEEAKSPAMGSAMFGGKAGEPAFPPRRVPRGYVLTFWFAASKRIA